MSQTYYQLKAHQRDHIEAYLKSGKRKSFIAEALDVSGSTIYREFKRNSSPKGIYLHLKHICLPQSVRNVISSLALLTPTQESSSKRAFCKNSGHLSSL